MGSRRWSGRGGRTHGATAAAHEKGTRPGKRFNAFAAEQWLTADGDGREPSSARDPEALCDRIGCVAALPEGEFLSIVLDSLAFDEDCARAEVVVSSLRAPAGCKAKFVLDEKALKRLGAIGLTFSDETGFTMTSDRSTEQNRPWSPAPPRALDERIARPGRLPVKQLGSSGLPLTQQTP